MGLTRIRAEQISDIDYKQAVRVISLASVTLSGGAPAEVDGVSLGTGNRILVAGQSNAAENGLYQVETVGAGSNGTWTRTSDANQDGEIQPGMTVMVTEGLEYADTPWKLVTNGVIEIGVTELIFEENYSLAFGNVFANGTAVIANVVSAGLTLTAGDNISITGNNTSKSITIGVTGISLNSIANGTSNVDIATANADVTVSVAGTANVAVFGNDRLIVAGNVLPSANVTYDLGAPAQRWNDIYLANSTIYLGNAQISANATSLILTNPEGAQTVFSGSVANIIAGTVTATGNITGGNLITSGILSVTGNANVGNIGATNANLTSITATANISGGNLSTAGQIEATGNITGGNLSTTGLTSTATLNSSGNANVGNLGTIGLIEATGNITGGNLVTAGLTSTATLNSSGNANVGNLGTAGLITATGNVTGGNVTTVGEVVATGNVTGGNLVTVGNVDGGNINATANITGIGAVFSGNVSASTFIGNISGNIDAGGANTTIQFNDDDILNGSAAFTFDKTSNVVTATGNISAGNITTVGVVDATGNITGGNLVTVGNVSANYFLGNVACASGIFTTKIFNGNSEANIVSAGGNLEISIGGVDDIVTVTSLGLQTTGTLTATANITGGNIITAGQVVATGNITGGNLAGTMITGTLTTASQPNVTSLGTLSSLTVVGPTTHTGNIDVTGNITVTGNLNYSNVTDLVVGDPLIFIGANNSGNIVDLGEVVQWNDGTAQYGGLVRDASDGVWKLFGNVTAQPTTTVDFTDALYQSILVGPLTASSGSFSTTLSATGNVSGGNINTIGLTSTATLNSSGNANVGNLGTAGSITATGNIDGGNLVSSSLGSAGNTAIIGTNNALTSTSSLFVDTANNRIGVGTVTPERTFDLVGNAAFTGDVQITQFNNSSDSGGIRIRKSRGADNAPSAVVDADTVGSIEFFLRDTSGFQQRASITSVVQVSGATYGADLAFGTGNGAGPTTRLYIAEGGAITFNSAYTFPTSDGSANSALVTNGAGVLSFTATPTFTSITATGNVTGGNILGNGSALTGINAFGTIVVAGSSDVVADNTSDTLTLVAGDGVVITTSAGTDTITISTSGSSESIFITGGDMGTVDEAVTSEEDLGLITDAVGLEIDMGTIVTAGVLYPDQLVLPSKTVAELGNLSAIPAGQFVYCSDESGGSIPAFSDGTNWRRVTDRAIVT
jgi:hypothetical protein